MGIDVDVEGAYFFWRKKRNRERLCGDWDDRAGDWGAELGARLRSDDNGGGGDDSRDAEEAARGGGCEDVK